LENRLTFEKVIAKSLVASFFGTRCIFICKAKDYGMTWTTNRRKAAVRGLVSQRITA